ncbi:MAG TPA: hypothetical protein VGF69_09635 [Thermoanaerobaculia bacterium]|jgi:hypothetical protein
MNDLTTEVAAAFDDTVGAIAGDPHQTQHRLLSDRLLTRIVCTHASCAEGMARLSTAFNGALKAAGSGQNTIEAFITESEEIFRKIAVLFQHPEWSPNERVRSFNEATLATSLAKSTSDGRFCIIKCYEYFYYVYDTTSNRCLMATTGEKKAMSMVNILLLTPYLLHGDLFAVHGGLVSDGRNSVLLSSTSLGGKTTFAFLFLENGWRIVTEETTYITRHGEPLRYNIRNYFNVRAGTYLEFKDFFLKAGIVADAFLAMADTARTELFDVGKKGQISIDFDALCANGGVAGAGRITHALKVGLDKQRSGMHVEQSDSAEVVDRFLEVSLAPTVMLFEGLTNMSTLDGNARKQELLQILGDVKSYTVTSGFDYRKNFDSLLTELGLSGN